VSVPKATSSRDLGNSNSDLGRCRFYRMVGLLIRVTGDDAQRITHEKSPSVYVSAPNA